MATTPRPNNRELLRRLILAKLLREAMGKQPAKQQQPKSQSDVEALLKQAKQAKDIYDSGKDIYGSLAGSGALDTMAGLSEATQATWNQAAGEASQAAWNAGADAASGISNAGTTTAPTTTTPNYAGYIAAATSAINDYQKLNSDKLTDEEKTLEASRAVPRAAAAYFTGGLSLTGENFARKQWGGTAKKLDKLAMKYDPFVRMGSMWTSDKWKTEGNRLKKLIDSGVNIPESLQAPMMLKRGRKKDELINKNYAADFVGQTKDGFINNKFANSRNEKDLRPEDIWGYSTFFEKYGNDWLGKMSEQQRRQIAQKALDSGAVRERHGTVDIDWNKVGDVNPIIGTKPATPTPPPAKRPAAPLTTSQSPVPFVTKSTTKIPRSVRA